MKKILLTILAVCTLSALSAQTKGTNELRVLWVEMESSNTSAQITGTSGSGYSSTQGDWTMGGTVPFPMADDHTALSTCRSLYPNAVPYVVFITPDGYYCSIYGEDYGIAQLSQASCNANMRSLLDSYPRAGQAPSVTESIPSVGAVNQPITFSVQVVSIEDYTVAWTFENGTPATATDATASCTWDTPGTYNVSVTVTNASGSTSANGTVVVKNYAAYFNFEQGTESSSFTFVDSDGDGYNWTVLTERGYESNACITSASWVQNTVLHPDNWFFTPAIDIPQASDIVLSWMDDGQDPDYAAEHYAVYVCTEATVASATATTPVWEGNCIGQWRAQSVNLDAYAGQTIYLAFRHYNVSDQFQINIDNIAIEVGEDNSAAPALTNNAPKATKSTPTWDKIGTPFTTYDFRDTDHQYPISLQAWLDSGFAVVVDYSACWCGPCFNLHRAKILDGYLEQFGPNFGYPFVGVETVEGTEVSVYPNPTTGIVNIEAEGLKNVEVLDMAGRVVMTSSKNILDISNLTNGVYMVRVNTIAGTATQKVVKK